MGMKKIKSESGFTLVEVLVALAIFGVVMSVVLQVFRVNYRNYALQEDVAGMQQNIRVAKMFLTRDVRMAGAGLYGTFYMTGLRYYPIAFTNAEGGSGTDSITIYYQNFDDAGCGTPASGIACDDLPQLTLKGSMPANSAAVTVEEELGALPFSQWDGPCDCKGVVYGPPPNTAGSWRTKLLIVSPDGTMADSVYITNVLNTGSDDKLINNAATLPTNLQANCGSGSDCNKVMNQYPAGSTISYFSETAITKVVYKVENNVLLRSNQGSSDAESFQPIAENIEDLQFAFGLDTNADGTVDTWINNASMDDLTDATTQTRLDQIRLVRINLLAQTQSRHPAVIGKTFTIEDNNSGAVDLRMRKLLTTTIKVRNMSS